MAKIAELAPKSPSEAQDDSKEIGKVDAVKSDVDGQVEKERAVSAGSLDEAAQAPPDMIKTARPLDTVDTL